MSQFGKPFESAAAGGSPMELAYKNIQNQTNTQQEIITNLRSGASRKTPKSRKSKTKKSKSKKIIKKKKGGAIPYTAPAHPVEPSNTKYPQSDLVKGLLIVGSQHQENSKYDSLINAQPIQYTDPNQVPKLGGRKIRKNKH